MLVASIFNTRFKVACDVLVCEKTNSARARYRGLVRYHRPDEGHEPLTNDQRSTVMKVKDLMTTDVKRCSPETNLAAAAKIMWEGDCGAVPVTDERDHVVGVITDRDICIAAATRPRTEGEIPVKD